MSNFAKITPEYDMYEAYSVSSNDSDGCLHEPILRPSEIVSQSKDRDYDSDSSDDYNEYHIIVNVKKNPSVIKSQLRLFKNRVSYLPKKIKGTFINEKQSNRLKKIFGGISLITGCIGLIFVLT